MGDFKEMMRRDLDRPFDWPLFCGWLALFGLIGWWIFR